jgi:hypothetical protein
MMASMIYWHKRGRGTSLTIRHFPRSGFPASRVDTHKMCRYAGNTNGIFRIHPARGVPILANCHKQWSDCHAFPDIVNPRVASMFLTDVSFTLLFSHPTKMFQLHPPIPLVRDAYRHPFLSLDGSTTTFSRDPVAPSRIR